MTTLCITYVTPLHPRGNYVQWEWKEDPPLGPWEFVLERSESPNGPFEIVSDPTVVDNLAFFDKLPTHHLHRYWYYRVSLKDGDTCEYTSPAQTYLSSEKTLDDRLRGEINELRYNTSILLRLDGGVEAWVFKRRNIGTTCPDCRSSLLNISTFGDCPTCLGTKWVGGYYPPVITRALFNDPPVQEGLDAEGETELRVFSLMMLDIPLLVVDDLIYEPGTGQLYEVKSVTTTRRQRVVVHQEPVISELSRSHPAYGLVNNIHMTRLGTEVFLFDSTFIRY